MAKVLHVLKWDQVRLKKLPGGVQRRAVTTRNIMVVQYVYQPHAVFPSHWHPQEQVVIVQQGEVDYEVEGVHYRLRAGDMLVVPSSAHHSAHVGKRLTITLNIFHPIREDLYKEAVKEMTLDQSLHRDPIQQGRVDG